MEARGVWVTRWDYHSEEEIRRIVGELASAGFNQIYFQVRGTADAYYRSTLEPWAAPLSGKLGKDPGWDPLRVAIDEAHQKGLELHAWINVATGWKGTLPPGRSRPRHVLRSHPGWRVADKTGRPMPYADGYVFLCPAHPGFQRHLLAVVAELASFYDVDGIHLDYARYPAVDTSFDRTSNRLFRRARRMNKGLDRAAWQRQELTGLIVELGKKVREVRPKAEISAAVTGIYRDRWGWGGVTQGLIDFHQDSHAWARRGAVDALLPMIYWPPTDPPGGRADFLALVEDFAPLMEHARLLVGINVEAGDFAVLEKEIRIARERNCHGVVLFAYAALRDRDWLGKLAETVFCDPALSRPTDPKVGWARVGGWLVEGLGLLVPGGSGR